MAKYPGNKNNTHQLPGDEESVTYVRKCHRSRMESIIGTSASITTQASSLTTNNNKVLPLVASAPTSSKNPHVLLLSSSDIPQTHHHINRSNSCIENKFKYTITSERLMTLKQLVETAIKQHKVFTIKGNWSIIRKELRKRNWVEKIESIGNNKQNNNKHLVNNEELISNLPIKQDWESPTNYAEKVEKTIMSRMLQNYDVDFYWSLRRDQGDTMHRSSSYKLMNRFNRSLFASKEGLSLLLQQYYWYTEPEVAFVNFPRCYVLGFPDHFNNFVEDYRITACLGLLKWLVHKYDTEDKFAIQSPDGRVPFTALKFALDRCTEYTESRKHLDIDKEYVRVWDHEWDQFLTNYYLVVHGTALFCDAKNHCLPTLYSRTKSALLELKKYWPESDVIDGMNNIWILKPGNKCRGRGIQLVTNINEVEKTMNMKMKYVVQKYIEKPLLIYKTKFDIRQWFLVASSQPLVIWMYRESYLRFSSQIFNLDNLHESLHLTNHAVQCKYTNMEQRDKALPYDNMWDCHTFQTYLKQIGCMEKWNDVILPGMRQSIVCTMLASQDVMDRRQNTFELYGADFMLSEDFKPWLIEINCSPDLSSSTSVTSRMCPQCMEDLIKVVIDRKRDPNANTGLFDLIYKQTLARAPPYLGMNLSVRGRKIFKHRNNNNSNKLKARLEKPQRLAANYSYLCSKRSELSKSEEINRGAKSAKPLQNPISSTGLYKGLVIEDLIVDLHRSLDSSKENILKKSKTEQLKKKYNETMINRSSNNNTRVPKRLCELGKLNQTDYVCCRKQNVKENISGKQQQRLINKNIRNDYFDLLNAEWTVNTNKNKISSDFNKFKEPIINKGGGNDDDDVIWEKETVSILKGKNILINKYNNSDQINDDGNKGCLKNNNYCV